MSIGVAFKCEDGIVLASDSQYTTGPLKTHGPKLFPLVDLPELAVGVVGAGRVSFMRRVVERMEKAFTALKHQPRLEDVRLAAESTLLQFFQQHIYPMPENKQRDFDFNLILGVWTKEGFGLFQTEETTVVPTAQDYASIGYGYYVSEYALSLTASNTLLNVENAKLIAALCVKAAKDHVDYCGGETSILVLQGTPPHHIRRIYKPEIYEAEQYTGDVLAVVSKVLGFLEVGPTTEFDDEMLELIVNELKKSMESLRTRRKDRQQLALKLEEKRRQQLLAKQGE